MEQNRSRVPRAPAVIPLQAFSTTASIRSGLLSPIAPRVRDGLFALLARKDRSASPSLYGLNPSPLLPRLRSAHRDRHGVDRTGRSHLSGVVSAKRRQLP